MREEVAWSTTPTARHCGGKASLHAGSERVAGFDFGHKAFRLGVVAPVDGHERCVDAVGDVGHRGRVAVDGDVERRREQRIGPGSVLLVGIALACCARHEVGADGHRGNEHQAEIYAGVVGRFHFLSEGGDGLLPEVYRRAAFSTPGILRILAQRALISSTLPTSSERSAWNTSFSARMSRARMSSVSCLEMSEISS